MRTQPSVTTWTAKERWGVTNGRGNRAYTRGGWWLRGPAEWARAVPRPGTDQREVKKTCAWGARRTAEGARVRRIGSSSLVCLTQTADFVIARGSCRLKRSKGAERAAAPRGRVMVRERM